jgi:hypothetical protein
MQLASNWHFGCKPAGKQAGLLTCQQDCTHPHRHTSLGSDGIAELPASGGNPRCRLCGNAAAWRGGDFRRGSAKQEAGGKRKIELCEWTTTFSSASGGRIVFLKGRGFVGLYRRLRIASSRACTSSQLGTGPKQRILHCFLNSVARIARSSGGGKRASLCAKVMPGGGM